MTSIMGTLELLCVYENMNKTLHIVMAYFLCAINDKCEAHIWGWYRQYVKTVMDFVSVFWKLQNIYSKVEVMHSVFTEYKHSQFLLKLLKCVHSTTDPQLYYPGSSILLLSPLAACIAIEGLCFVITVLTYFWLTRMTFLEQLYNMCCRKKKRFLCLALWFQQESSHITTKCYCRQ